MDYLNFDLEIGKGNGLEYPISVRSPAGEVHEVMEFPYTREQIELRLAHLKIALLSSASIARQVLSPELQSVQDMGKDFFNALFSGDVRSQYDQSQRIALGQNKGLRIRLRIQSAEISALPWEYLYDPRNCEYLSLSSNTPLVRYLEVQQAIRPITITPPLRILGMICAPSNLPDLNVEQEKRRVEEALTGLRERGQVELVWLKGETCNDLQDALLEGHWHIFHFIGHGDFDYDRDEGYLMLTSEDGKARRLHATELARLLADHREIRVVVLNACQGARSSWESVFSSTAAVLVRRGIACAVAMQFSITDTAAVELSRRFYSTLARGLPVDMALTEARKAISVNFQNSVEWGTPVLFMRAPDGMLFQITDLISTNKPDEAKPKSLTFAKEKGQQTNTTAENSVSNSTKSPSRPISELTRESRNLAGQEKKTDLQSPNSTVTPLVSRPVQTNPGSSSIKKPEGPKVPASAQSSLQSTTPIPRAIDQPITTHSKGTFNQDGQYKSPKEIPRNPNVSKIGSCWLAISVGSVAILLFFGCFILFSILQNLDFPKSSVKETSLSTPRTKAPNLAPSLTQSKVTLSLYQHTPVPTRTATIKPILTQTPTPTPTKVVTSTWTPQPTLGIGSMMISPMDGMVLVYVPEGDFLMGSSRYGDDPQQTVYLNAFWIDQNEVTIKQYKMCAKDKVCLEPTPQISFNRSKYYTEPKYENYPVLSVTWNDAAKYCRWTGRRLPTEAEWEKAARGTDKRIYPWGNQEPNCTLANIKGCEGDTAQVGSYPKGASPYLAQDMAGNMWEWVNDFYAADYYQSMPRSNPTGPLSGTMRIARGGCWGDDNFDWLTVSYRFTLNLEYKSSSVGFRCVLPAKN